MRPVRTFKLYCSIETVLIFVEPYTVNSLMELGGLVVHVILIPDSLSKDCGFKSWIIHCVVSVSKILKSILLGWQ